MNPILRLFSVTIASYCLLNSLSLPTSLQNHSAQWDQAAYAKRSGGRSRGGSFDGKPSSNNNSPSRSNGGGSSGGSSDRSRGLNNSGGGYSGGGYSGGGYGGYGGYRGNSGGSSIGAGFLLLIGLIVVGGIGLAIWYIIWANKGNSPTNSELGNEIVTLSKIQVALLAQDKAIQPRLAELVANADLSTSEGLQQHLQESALALLRSPANWSHVQTHSETVKTRTEAESRFEKWSIEERTKYAEETLTNLEGKLTRRDYSLDPDKDPASYIVVTLLLGTADDKPLFPEVRTTENLKDVLQKISSLNPDYLLIFELIWTPQAEGDSLTYDELLTDYADMLQI